MNIVNSNKVYLRITTEMSLIDSYSEDFGSDLDAIENEKKNDTTTEYSSQGILQR